MPLAKRPNLFVLKPKPKLASSVLSDFFYLSVAGQLLVSMRATPRVTRRFLVDSTTRDEIRNHFYSGTPSCAHLQQILMREEFVMIECRRKYHL